MLTKEELDQINRFSKAELTADQVYTFSVRLCDNEVDRDFERFPAQTLEALAPLFLGKSGIFDHNWSARNQSARIFSTQVISEPERVTQAGDPYCWLKARAYMVRTDDNRGLIAEIDGGIKKEVSVGCAVKRRVCSICGEEAGAGCGHQPGQVYDGKLCYLSLEEPADAYEFSFVAVPAQPQAGVVKAMGGKHYETLKELLADYPRFAGEIETLKAQAELGVRALKELHDRVVVLDLENLAAADFTVRELDLSQLVVGHAFDVLDDHQRAGDLLDRFILFNHCSSPPAIISLICAVMSAAILA